MINIDDAVVAKLKLTDEDKVKRHGELVFEILVDCDKAMAFKESKASIDDALVTFDIFTDVKKGEHASEHILEVLKLRETVVYIRNLLIYFLNLFR